MDVSYAINPDSSLIPIARIEGFTAAATNIKRSGFLFKGQGAIMHLTDDDALQSLVHLFPSMSQTVVLIG